MKLKTNQESRNFCKMMCRYSSRFLRNYSGAANIFDRNTKRLQRSRAALAEDSRDYDFLKNEVASQLVERLFVSLSLLVLFCFRLTEINIIFFRFLKIENLRMFWILEPVVVICCLIFMISLASRIFTKLNSVVSCF